MSKEIFVNFGSGNSMVSIRQPIFFYLNQGRYIQVDSSTLSEIYQYRNIFMGKFHLEMPSGKCGSFVQASMC